MASILILVGTESGNAQMVADALKPVLATAGHTVDVTDKAATRADLEAHDVLLVVCATHGSGDIPTNIQPLAQTLERERPDLWLADDERVLALLARESPVFFVVPPGDREQRFLGLAARAGATRANGRLLAHGVAGEEAVYEVRR